MSKSRSRFSEMKAKYEVVGDGGSKKSRPLPNSAEWREKVRKWIEERYVK